MNPERNHTMELIVINQSKLKIMLTPPDMKAYDLSPARMDCTDEETRRSFRRIFEDARAQIGFDTTGERLFVQLYTSRGGGCEIFVTKLGGQSADADDGVADGLCADDTDAAASTPEEALLRRVFSVEADTGPGRAPSEPAAAESADDAGSCPGEAAPIPARRPGRLPRRITTRPAALTFADMDSLLAACRRLSENRYDGESSAYILESGTPVLLLSVPDTSFFRLPAAYAFLTEYGDETDPAVLSLLLREHASLLCGAHAAETLGRLA